jgi:hypothetical protein
MKRNWLLILVAAGFLASPVLADTIDFESPNPGATGFVTSLSTLTLTNTVTFYLGAAVVPGGGTAGAWVHEYGTPTTAFVPEDADSRGQNFKCVNFDCDQPEVKTFGDYFLSDEEVAENGLVDNLPYGFGFSTPVTELTLDLLDFRGDGGTATNIILTAYSDIFGTSVSSWNIPIPSNPKWGDPSAYRFTTGPGPAFSSFTVAVTGGNGRDVGTGIDNITFETVPEPGTLGLIGAGLLGLVARARRRRQD